MRHVYKYPFAFCLIVMAPFTDVAAAADARAELADWIKAAGGNAEGLAAWPELQFEGGAAFRTKDTVYLKLTDWPASTKVAFPRLNNPTKNVYLLGKPDDDLKLTPEPSKWIVALPKALPDGARAVVVVKTIGTPHLPKVPEQVAADDTSAFILPAHKAVTHGEMLRYEPQPHKNTVGYWTKPADWAEWHIDVKRAGKYTLYILQGCGKGQGGSEVGIVIRTKAEATANQSPLLKSTLIFNVEDTGHFQNFVLRELGEIEFGSAGEFTLELHPRQLAKNAVMDVREVRLVPNPDK